MKLTINEKKIIVKALTKLAEKYHLVINLNDDIKEVNHLCEEQKGILELKEKIERSIECKN